MKKILAFTLAVLLMVSVLPLAAAAMGEWKEAEDGTITDELREIFDKAIADYRGLLGVTLTPVELLETQSVSGMNYKFLCEGSYIRPDSMTAEYIVIIGRSISGECSVISVKRKEPVTPIHPGEWTEPEDGTITDELREIFESATGETLGFTLEPLELLGVQQVAGINYKFLCEGGPLVPDVDPVRYIAIIFRALDGTCTFISLEEVESPVQPGEWVDAEDTTVTEELRGIFDSAMSKKLGVQFEPVKLLATQLVSGTNYKFLCNGKVVAPDTDPETYIIVINKNPQGNCTVVSIEIQNNPIGGGWEEAEDPTITEELLEIFNSAAGKHTGINFIPLQLLATQAVSGMNYKFRCYGVPVVLNPKTYEYIVVVYKDASGNCSITELENLGEVGLEDEWVEAEDQTVTAELKEIFEKAVESYLGMDFEPLKLLATQMVSGMNYKFLCEGTTVSAKPEVAQYIVIVYRDLKGNCSVFSVERVSDPEPVPVPPTGDASLAIWIALLLASVICAAVVLSEKKRIAVR